MKLSILLVITIFFISGTPPDNCLNISEFKAEKQGLKGKVKSIREYYQYDAVKNYETGKWEKRDWGSYEVEIYSAFSEDRLEMEYTSITPEGKIISRYIPVFENGCYKGFKEYSDSNKLISNYVLTETHRDKKMLFAEFSDQYSAGKTMVYYDSLTRPVRMIQIAKTGEKQSEIFREYNKNNLITMEKFCLESDSCNETKTEYIKFDSKGNWTQKLLIRKYPYSEGHSIVERKIEYYN